MAKSLYEMPADVTFDDAARKVLRAGFDKMVDNLEGTRAGLAKSVATADEIEALHDMRVGSRRLRAALAVFGGVFSPRDFAALDKEIGRITDALGAVRDLDVQLDMLRGLQSTLPANEAYGIGRLIVRQTALRDKETVALRETLTRMEKDRFARRFRRLLDGAVPRADTDKAAAKKGDS